MFALFLTAFLACSSETKETTTESTTTPVPSKTDMKKVNDSTPTKTSETTTDTTGVKAPTTDQSTTIEQQVEDQTSEVKEFVEKAVNTSETE
jgi:hypothetical protein